MSKLEKRTKEMRGTEFKFGHNKKSKGARRSTKKAISKRFIDMDKLEKKDGKTEKEL